MKEKDIKEYPLQFFKGVGPKRAKAFAESGVLTTRDILFYRPRTYVSHERIPTLAALGIKLRREKSFFDSELDFNNDYRTEITVLARVINHKEIKFGRNRKLLVIEVADGSGGRAFIKFWSYVDFFKKQYPLGELLSISGVPEIDDFNKIGFNHPVIEKHDIEDEKSFKKGSILPVYPISDKMRKSGISNNTIRNLIFEVIDKELSHLRESLPQKLIKKLGLMPLNEAVQLMHFPNTSEDIDKSNYRLKFGEIFYFELVLAKKQLKYKNTNIGVKIAKKSSRARQVYENLHFDLTNDQKKVINEIMTDLNSNISMNRLLQGDVGSGKTIVAFLTMLSVIDSGYQVAIIAPTELLAEQHFLSFKKLSDGLDIEIQELIGAQKKKYREEILDSIKSGKTNIIVGTHAMFESSVEYNNLGYIIIDEQHRFGVEQRARLINLAAASLGEGKVPHILAMSATPIPRTLSHTLYGDLDNSTIKEMPKNRKPIKTKVVFDSDIEKVYDFIRKRVQEGEQVYIVYPLVEKSDKIELKSAEEYFEKLDKEVFPDIKCGLLHGQLLGYEKEDVMNAFLRKEYGILIATTVIEVGIDVPNATIMVIEDAERFGLSQLHQMRGRVGRSDKQSYCILITKDKFSYELKRTDKAEEEKMAAIVRLKTMEKTADGFEIAEVDMRLRGPGDMMGTRQSGIPDFKYIDLINDTEIISIARKEAFNLAKNDPEFNKQENKIIKYFFTKNADLGYYYDIT